MWTEAEQGRSTGRRRHGEARLTYCKQNARAAVELRSVSRLHWLDVMKLIIQPRDGITPLVTAIRGARKEIDLLIFRCDRKEIGQAVDTAVKRGVRVRVLIANTNHGGEKQLRKLELETVNGSITLRKAG